MSRLPRLRSSSPAGEALGPTMPANVTTRNLKRKAIVEEEEEEPVIEQPRKVVALGVNRPNRPLQPTRTATNVPRLAATTSKPLAKPQPPPLTRSRGTSAPPARLPSSKPSTSARGAPSRTVSSSYRSRNSDDKRFSELQEQLTSIESARVADATRLAMDMDAERNKVAELQANHVALSHELATARSQEINQRRELVNFSEEIEQLKKQHGREIMDLEMDIRKRERELRDANEDLRLCRSDLERERANVSTLKATLSQQSTAHITLTTQIQALETQNSLLRSQNDALSQTLSQRGLNLESSEKIIEQLKKEILEGEIVRRKLHNMVQELKGNIRVFCRVRPILSSDFNNIVPSFSSNLPSPSPTPEELEALKLEAQANMAFPDRHSHKEIVVSSTSESATGQERKEVYNFTFDRVFEPTTTQAEVFEDISLLAQSCMDGYNVCIFAYGQTGSGKSFTMEGGQTSSLAGMIPRAVEQVFRVAEEMRSKGWEYTMEGQFLEIYNETINDLLGKGEFDKKKHEIKHDPKTGTTRVTDTNVVALRSASQVRSLLTLANSRRSVAATLMNERSSRSHSVFTLRISGVNTGFPPSDESSERVGGTGERCEGCLNLVDLAGSERLNVSFGNGPGVGPPDKERVRETQNINKSLSALGDVIAALGEKGEKGDKHIPYRNSKLTYLLQNSLSGNSKTLMFLNLSPLAAHLNESLTSLRFATKVNNTQIGTAKKQLRMS